MTCEHCGKEWQFGTCESTVSRRARCERVSAEQEAAEARPYSINAEKRWYYERIPGGR